MTRGWRVICAQRSLSGIQRLCRMLALSRSGCYASHPQGDPALPPDTGPTWTSPGRREDPPSGPSLGGQTAP